ncbi:23S rRNA (guanosine(2251)-2'-O)-methyltransferase RlmB [Hugenholtzia roseola]|uniref:23S rRNA (guanosine(2251)-2'-O)-methyltransferase RlmB n=1 Tax=Hugenholtzia roseola TaxID=1002 RepID=UPI000688DBC1|nr:23S rRNA (guanosine(2251)-2'-O)-methyltransferase RlmB [Hugenholtzia roseola]
MTMPASNFQKPTPKDFIFGIHPVLEALYAETDMEKIFIQKDLNSPHIEEILKLAKGRRVMVQRTPKERLDRITRKVHQGVIAFLSLVPYADVENIVAETYLKGKVPFVLALDRITDVRNFGAMVRSAECAGVDAILIPEKGAARIGSDAVKTSAGAIHHIPICKSHNFWLTLRNLKDAGLQLVAATEKGSDSPYQTDFNLPTVVVMGSEEDGITEAVLSLADRKVAIPLRGKIGSLNVSVAAGVLLFEALRQKTEK